MKKIMKSKVGWKSNYPIFEAAKADVARRKRTVCQCCHGKGYKFTEPFGQKTVCPCCGGSGRRSYRRKRK